MTQESEVVVATQPYGDSALLVTTASGTPQRRWHLVHALAAQLETKPPFGVLDFIPAYDTLLIQIETAPTAHERIQTWVRSAAAQHRYQERPDRARVFHIPTVYGNQHGPDLQSVATELGLSPEQVITMHAQNPWVVRIMGAPVGAPMMDRSPYETPVRRCPEPRTAVPAGSVALAGRQGVVYPVTSPGGWRLIGRTPLRLVDIDQTPPAPYRPGDIFQFHPIEPSEWHRFDGRRPEPTDA